MIRLGLLGCGRIGQVHARAIKENSKAVLVAVSDAVEGAAMNLAQQTGAEVRETAEIINAGDVDAVIIGTPTTTHYDLIHAAALAGKAIFCEKPVDLSSARIKECIEVVEANGVSFFTAFNRRFDPNFAALKQRIDNGDIGQVELVTILSRDPAPPPLSYIATSGGLFRDMMIHDLDMARYLLGEDPISVFAVGSCLVDPAIGDAGDVDTAAVTLTTASGAICQISNSRRASYGYDQRIEVHGSDGLLRADNQLETTVEYATGSGFARAPAQHFFLERYERAYAAEMASFIASLDAGTPPSPGIHDGLKAQQLADAAADSLIAGTPIQMANMTGPG